MSDAPQPEIVIRFAEESQIPLILSFIRKLADYEKLSSAVVADEATLRKSLFGPKPAGEVLLAHSDGIPAGIAIFFHNFSTFLGCKGVYLEDLFVEPEYRGKGIGKALLQRVAQIALERECQRLDWAVLDWNDPALGFYRRIGAVALDDWTVHRLTGAALEDLAAGSAK